MINRKRVIAGFVLTVCIAAHFTGSGKVCHVWRITPKSKLRHKEVKDVDVERIGLGGGASFADGWGLPFRGGSRRP